MVGHAGVRNDLPELVVDVKGALGCEFLGLDGLLEGLVWLRLDALLGGLVEGVGDGQWDHVVLHFFISWFCFRFVRCCSGSQSICVLSPQISVKIDNLRRPRFRFGHVFPSRIREAGR